MATSPPERTGRQLVGAWSVPTVLGVASVAIGVVLAAGMRRGLDLTDEGLYLLSVQRPRDVLRSSTQFQLVLAPLWWLAGDVWMYRLFKLIALWTSAFAVGRSTLGFIEARSGRYFTKSFRMGMAFSVGLIGLTPYGWLPLSPGYNELLAVLAWSGVAIVFRLAARERSTRSEHRLVLGLGVVWLSTVLTKWPSAVVLGVVLLVATVLDAELVACCSRSWKWFVGGVGLGLGLAQLVSGSLFAVASGVRLGSGDLDSSYELSGLIAQYVRNVVEIPELAWRRFPAAVGLAVVLLLLGAVRSCSKRRWVVMARGCAAACVASVVGTYAFRAGFRGLIDGLASLVLIAIVVEASYGVLSVDRSWPNRPRPCVPLILAASVLTALPFLLALGTNNPILFNAAATGAPLWACAILLASFAWPNQRGGVVGPAVTVCVGLAIAIVATHSVWASPYRQPSLSAATERIDVGPLAGLRVAPDTHTLISEAAELIADAERPSVVAVYKAPGIAAATGARQPIHGWIPQTDPIRATRAVASACADSSRVLLVLVGTTIDDPALPARCGVGRWVRSIASPDGYEFWIGEPTPK